MQEEPRRASSRVATVTGFAGFLLLGGLAGGMHDTFFPNPAVQPVAFNHRKHVKDNELACSTCHEFFEREAFSGLPDERVCAACHEEAQGKSAEEAKLRSILQSGRPLRWSSLFRQPAHVYYSHRRHVKDGGIECTACHGGIADTERPPEKVTRLRMGDCIACHRAKGASTACTTCHR